MTEVAEVLRGFFDDASPFPPASLPLPEAVAAHRTHRTAWYAPLVGNFVCLWSRLSEVPTDSAAEPIRVSLILPEGPADLERALAECVGRADLRLGAVEVTLPDGMTPREALWILDEQLPSEVIAYLEVPPDHRQLEVLDALAVTRYRAKFRTGGTTPQAHPTEWELANAIQTAVHRMVPFKCTAGLHHAVRHTDGALEQHGFLNVLLAVDVARHGADVGALAAVLESRSAEAIGNEIARVAAVGRLVDARALFVAIGTCSIDDPIADLVALNLLPGIGADVAGG
jgi:hypothetical protein